MYKRVLRYALNSFLPDRSKRAILVSSLLGCMAEKRHLEDTYLELLNQRLDLSTKYQELKFPMVACKSVWPSDAINFITSKQFLNEDEMRELAKKLVDYVPSWLKYNNESAITDDIVSAIRFETSVSSAK